VHTPGFSRDRDRGRAPLCDLGLHVSYTVTLPTVGPGAVNLSIRLTLPPIPTHRADGYTFPPLAPTDFQMQYARETWLEERSSWRAIIQLNLIRSVVTLLDLLGEALTHPASNITSVSLTEKHRLLRLRLAPLRGVQQDLQHRLGAASIEESNNPGSGAVMPRPSEFAVRSRDGWRSALERFRTRPHDTQGNARAADARVRKAAEVTEVVVGCADDMKALWEDGAVQEMLRRKKIRMEEEPGLYVAFLPSLPLHLRGFYFC
jgi:G-protein alpha subunit